MFSDHQNTRLVQLNAFSSDKISLAKKMMISISETIENKNVGQMTISVYDKMQKQKENTYGTCICFANLTHSKCIDHERLTLQNENPEFQAFPKQALVFLQYKSFENTVGNREIARNKQFLLFPQCFLPV